MPSAAATMSSGKTKANPLHSQQHTAGIFSDMTIDGPEIGTLVLVVDRAKNLPNRKTIGKQDPYCAARLGKEAKKTATDIRGGQTPKWDQELRFIVHDSPDYYQLKVSVFNDDKKTDLIGETWIDLRDIVKMGGGQSDQWQTLSCKGKYAGDIRMEITYYDRRPKPEKAIAKAKPALTATGSPIENNGDGGTARAAVKRRPLPTNPGSESAPPPRVRPSVRPPPGPHSKTQPAPEVAKAAPQVQQTHTPIQTPPRSSHTTPSSSSYAVNQSSPHQGLDYGAPPPQQAPSPRALDLHHRRSSERQHQQQQHETFPAYDQDGLQHQQQQYHPDQHHHHHHQQQESRPHYGRSSGEYESAPALATSSQLVHHSQKRQTQEMQAELPPPPPLHRARNSSGAPDPMMHRASSSYELVQHKPTSSISMRQDVLRNEAHRMSISTPSDYPGRPAYRAYAPDMAYDASSPVADQHHQNSSHGRSMQATVEDVPESWTPPKNGSARSRHSYGGIPADEGGFEDRQGSGGYGYDEYDQAMGLVSSGGGAPRVRSMNMDSFDYNPNAPPPPMQSQPEQSPHQQHPHHDAMGEYGSAPSQQLVTQGHFDSLDYDDNSSAMVGALVPRGYHHAHPPPLQPQPQPAHSRSYDPLPSNAPSNQMVPLDYAHPASSPVAPRDYSPNASQEYLVSTSPGAASRNHSTTSLGGTSYARGDEAAYSHSTDLVRPPLSNTYSAPPPPPSVPTTLIPGVDNSASSVPSMAIEVASRFREHSRRQERRYTQPVPMNNVTMRGRQQSEPPQAYPPVGGHASSYDEGYHNHAMSQTPPHGRHRSYPNQITYSSGPSTPSGPAPSSHQSSRNRSPNPNSNTSPSHNHTIKRKSVSPIPPRPDDRRRLSAIPFGPDSYDSLNPALSEVATTTPTGEYTNAYGKIVTADGREVDPSDHLPMDTWAPEPEPNNNDQAVTKDNGSRPVPAGAQPMPASGKRQLRVTVRNSQSPSSSSTSLGMQGSSQSLIKRPDPLDASPAPSSQLPPRAGRNRLQKKSHRMSAGPTFGRDSSGDLTNGGWGAPLGPATSRQRNSTPPQALVYHGGGSGGRENWNYGAGAGGGYAAPPVPAKVPFMSGALIEGERETSLMEEMRRIDIGSGRSRRHGGGY